MVFANEIRTLKKLGIRLAAAGMRVTQLHGERSQRERDEALQVRESGSYNMGGARTCADAAVVTRGIPSRADVLTCCRAAVDRLRT
jgi:superfamily II DNA/RNA helicase